MLEEGVSEMELLEVVEVTLINEVTVFEVVVDALGALAEVLDDKLSAIFDDQLVGPALIKRE